MKNRSWSNKKHAEKNEERTNSWVYHSGKQILIRQPDSRSNLVGRRTRNCKTNDNKRIFAIKRKSQTRWSRRERKDKWVHKETVRETKHRQNHESKCRNTRRMGMLISWTNKYIKDEESRENKTNFTAKMRQKITNKREPRKRLTKKQDQGIIRQWRNPIVFGGHWRWSDLFCPNCSSLFWHYHW